MSHAGLAGSKGDAGSLPRVLISHCLKAAPELSSPQLPPCLSFSQSNPGSQRTQRQIMVGVDSGLCGQSRCVGHPQFLPLPPPLSKQQPHPLVLRPETLPSSLSGLSHLTSRPAAGFIGSSHCLSCHHLVQPLVHIASKRCLLLTQPPE